MCRLFLPSGDTFSSCGGKKHPKKSERDNLKHDQSEPTRGDGEWMGSGGAGPNQKSKVLPPFLKKKKGGKVAKVV